MNKHYTFQEYLEKFTSIQDSYDYYFELQKEIDRLEDQLQQKENIIKEVREYIEENEKEYGSLEDNEKIILGILDKEKV